MKTVNVSEFNWNVNCPTCGELIDIGSTDLAEGEIVKCGHCLKPVKIHLVNSIKEAEEML